MPTPDITIDGRLGDLPVGRLGYGAMQLAGPGVFGPPRDAAAAVGGAAECRAARRRPH